MSVNDIKLSKNVKIITKVLMFAEDKKIKDESILEQIR